MSHCIYDMKQTTHNVLYGWRYYGMCGAPFDPDGDGKSHYHAEIAARYQRYPKLMCRDCLASDNWVMFLLGRLP